MESNDSKSSTAVLLPVEYTSQEEEQLTIVYLEKEEACVS